MNGSGDQGAARLAAFEADLDLHGPDFERWPEEARRAAEALIAKEPRAAASLAAARAVETGLRAPAPGDRPDADVIGGVLARSAAARAKPAAPEGFGVSIFRAGRAPLRPAAGLAAAAGLALGLFELGRIYGAPAPVDPVLTAAAPSLMEAVADPLLDPLLLPVLGVF
ncbi:MAG: hypothetical protein AAFW46_04255 [Pseudomonadota bacterium]